MKRERRIKLTAGPCRPTRSRQLPRQQSVSRTRSIRYCGRRLDGLLPPGARITKGNPKIPRAGLGRFAIALCVALAGCSYSAPRWQHQIESGIPLPGSTLAAIAVKSESLRWPEGFIAQFPDGGSAKVVERRASIYVVDTESRTQRLIGTLTPGPAIRSGFDVRLLGWSPDGSECYAEIFGHTGATSDTPVARQVFRVSLAGEIGPREIPSSPETMVSPKNGEFDAKRRLHTWPTDISLQIWTPGGAPTTVLFTLDPISGQLKKQ